MPATDVEIEVYPIFNRRTRSGYPVRYRWRTPHNGRVKSYATPEACMAAVQQLFPGVKDAAIKVFNHIRR